ncbi:arsenate reductase (glutaredoxin) [Robiginitomaculum antarcticum]|uniref:arsenate reductase (glutaredoxin) n=1 Tax=Robiginitomaculum antarcticum TaxID=437507 RepID=UPI00037F668E|nr:arsenate reductase (glutaredoxin) [Robiginitomaculum antarcticum]
MLKIYHNPRCSKSRETLSLLQQNGHEPDVVEYLKKPLEPRAIKKLADKMGITDYREMMRTGEAIFKAQALDKAPQGQLLSAMALNPILIERPIVETDAAAAIGRPPENVLKLF